VIPRRTAICLDCRTLLVEGEPCDASPEHTAVSLTDDDGRRRLVEAQRRPVADPFTSVGAWSGGGARGRVIAEEPLTSPLLQERCCGWSAALVFFRDPLTLQAGTVVLRDAVTSGFALRLDEGSVVLVPAGRIRLEAERPGFPSGIRRNGIRYLKELYPVPFPQALELDPFRFTDGEEYLIRSGDRLEILNELPPIAGERTPARPPLQPRGLPRFRQLPPDHV